MKIIEFLTKRYFFLFFITAIFLFTIGYDYSYPIEVNPDEVAQLKNIYAMIQSKSLFLQYSSSYSVWTHYIYIIPVILYWGVFYLFSNLNDIYELQFYILNNYYQVIPFLRLFTAILFIISLFFVREIIKNTLNIIQANLFFIFISLNLIIIINSHYAKHWIVDISLIFFSFYFYYKYNLNRKKAKFLIISLFLFSFAVLSSYPLVSSGVYFILIYYYFQKQHSQLIKDFFYFLFIFSFMFIYTSLAGFGHLANNIELNFDIKILYKLLFFTFDYDPIVTLLFLSSLCYLIYSRNLKFLIAMIPYLSYLIFLSFFDAQPRYALFLVIDAAFIATFFSYYIYKKNKKMFFIMTIIYATFNFLIAIQWLNIITNKDTRVLTKEWLSKNTTRNDFIIYNTFGFNYLPLTKESINIIKKLAPNTISTREELHLKYNLKDGLNGLILWKIDQNDSARKNIINIIKNLKDLEYNILIINERFGKIAKFDQPSKRSFKMLKDNFSLKELNKFEPYKNSPKNIEKIGDIIINFENVIQTMYYLKQPGPTVSIYKIEEKIHE